MQAKLARDKDGKLTNWETGRRFVFITIPRSPLEKDLQVGIFSAEIYYQEMKARREEKYVGVHYETTWQNNAQMK